MKDITVQTEITIRQAMKVLDKTAEKCLLVVDEKNKFLGTLTDGDLRRSILSGANFSENISASYNAEPTILLQDEYSEIKAEKLLRWGRLKIAVSFLICRKLELICKRCLLGEVVRN